VAGDSANPRVTRSAHIHEQLDLVGGRDLQLWSIGLLIIVVLAAGFSALVVPNMVWKASVGSLNVQEKYLPQLFYGLISLVLLFNAYIVMQKRSLNATRAALISELAFNERLETMSLIDPATQLFSRPALDQFALHEISRANRTGNSLTFLMVHVQLPGAENGSPQADRLIGEAAQLMKGTFRGGDILIRYSGDKFLVLMPDTNRRQGERATARLREAADQWNLSNAEMELSLNCGVAEYRTGSSLSALLLQAEQRIGAPSPA
jgi:diguanylate cyclase (GGDEF)-like protein